MELCSMWRGALLLLFFLISPRPKRKSSAPHPAEPEPPQARAELRALRSAVSPSKKLFWRLLGGGGGVALGVY
jgi:hypothetical protein